MFKRFPAIVLMLAVQCGLLLSLYAANINNSITPKHHTNLSEQLSKTFIFDVEEEDLPDKNIYDFTLFAAPYQLQYISESFAFNCRGWMFLHTDSCAPEELFILSHKLLI